LVYSSGGGGGGEDARKCSVKVWFLAAAAAVVAMAEAAAAAAAVAAAAAKTQQEVVIESHFYIRNYEGLFLDNITTQYYIVDVSDLLLGDFILLYTSQRLRISVAFRRVLK
jgi:hypothetical protein